MTEPERLTELLLSHVAQRQPGSDLERELLLLRHAISVLDLRTLCQDHQSCFENVVSPGAHLGHAPRYNLAMTTTPQDQRDNPVAHHVSDEVRAWLGRKRRTQSDLARHMGIAKSAVSVRLNGSREFSISELVEIAAWLDISLADLLGPELLQARRSPRGDMVTAGAEGKEWALWC